MTSIYKYRVKCTTDNKYEYIWADSEPTTCPTNTAHTIDCCQTSIIQVIDPNTVTINEMDVQTGGHYKMICQKMPTVYANTIGSHDFSFKIPINVISGYTKTGSDQIGDIISFDVSPDTVIGILNQDISINDTIIYVSQAVIELIYLGLYIKFDDGTNITTNNQIIAIDKVNNTFTVEDPIDTVFLAVTPTILKITINYVENVEIAQPGNYYIGQNKIGSSYVSANTVIRLRYDNKGQEDKTPIFILEILY